MHRNTRTVELLIDLLQLYKIYKSCNFTRGKQIADVNTTAANSEYVHNNSRQSDQVQILLQHIYTCEHKVNYLLPSSFSFFKSVLVAQHTSH